MFKRLKEILKFFRTMKEEHDLLDLSNSLFEENCILREIILNNTNFNQRDIERMLDFYKQEKGKK